MTYSDLLNTLQLKFPQLSVANSRATSPFDEGYNCIAWAADDADHWWWPDSENQNYWPPGVPREESIEAFIHAYGTLGYLNRANSTLEPHKQKIAIYAINGRPKHASRQISDGWWASKLGPQIDIEHEFAALEGPEYGTVAVILERRK